MKGKWASSRVDMGYTELFCIPVVTAVFLLSLTVFLGTPWCSIKHIEAPYVFDWEHRIALPPMQGIWVLTPAEGMSPGISRLQQEPGVYSRLTAGMAVRNSTWFREVRIPVFLGRTPQEAKLGLAG